jgi:hypothetical protein
MYVCAFVCTRTFSWWRAYCRSVVYHDGDVWRAVLDTKETGELASYEALTDYRIEQKYLPNHRYSFDSPFFCLIANDTLSMVMKICSHIR